MQNRLVTFGCSFTFGHGLEDCFVPPSNPGLNPSQFAWPSLLSADLNLPLINMGKCGASNLEILYSLLEFQLTENDLVILMWSFPDRDLIFQENQKVSLGVWENSPLIKQWARVHTKEDLAIRSWIYIHHASCYLKSRGIRHYNLFANYIYLKRFQPKFLNVDYLDYDMSKKLDHALDNLHPGPKTHRELANRLKTRIEDKT
jgi:hypothetical protein